MGEHVVEEAAPPVHRERHARTGPPVGRLYPHDHHEPPDPVPARMGAGAAYPLGPRFAGPPQGLTRAYSWLTDLPETFVPAPPRAIRS